MKLPKSVKTVRYQNTISKHHYLIVPELTYRIINLTSGNSMFVDIDVEQEINRLKTQYSINIIEVGDRELEVASE